MIELIGILGGALFAAGCVPMAFRTWRQGKDLGTPLETQWLLFLACCIYSVYLFGAFGSHLAFWFLVIEVISWGVALWYHYFPRHGGWSSEKVRKAFNKAADASRRSILTPDADGEPYEMRKFDGEKKPCPHGWSDWDDCPVCCH